MDLTSNFDSKFRIFPNISTFGQFNFNPVSIFGKIVTLFQDLTSFHSKVTKSFGHRGEGASHLASVTLLYLTRRKRTKRGQTLFYEWKNWVLFTFYCVQQQSAGLNLFCKYVDPNHEGVKQIWRPSFLSSLFSFHLFVPLSLFFSDTVCQRSLIHFRLLGHLVDT